MWNPVEAIGTGVVIAIAILLILYINRYRLKTYKVKEDITVAHNRFGSWLTNGAYMKYYLT